MTVTELMAELDAAGVKLKILNGSLFCRPAGLLTPELESRVQSSKAELIIAVRARDFQCYHADPECFKDAVCPDRPGWIRTTCRHCAGFIGNRPVGRE